MAQALAETGTQDVKRLSNPVIPRPCIRPLIESDANHHLTIHACVPMGSHARLLISHDPPENVSLAMRQRGQACATAAHSHQPR